MPCEQLFRAEPGTGGTLASVKSPDRPSSAHRLCPGPRVGGPRPWTPSKPLTYQLGHGCLCGHTGRAAAPRHTVSPAPTPTPGHGRALTVKCSWDLKFSSR